MAAWGASSAASALAFPGASNVHGGTQCQALQPKWWWKKHRWLCLLFQAQTRANTIKSASSTNNCMVSAATLGTEKRLELSKTLCASSAKLPKLPGLHGSSGGGSWYRKMCGERKPPASKLSNDSILSMRFQLTRCPDREEKEANPPNRLYLRRRSCLSTVYLLCCSGARSSFTAQHVDCWPRAVTTKKYLEKALQDTETTELGRSPRTWVV